MIGHVYLSSSIASFTWKICVRAQHLTCVIGDCLKSTSANEACEEPLLFSPHEYLPLLQTHGDYEIVRNLDVRRLWCATRPLLLSLTGNVRHLKGGRGEITSPITTSTVIFAVIAIICSLASFALTAILVLYPFLGPWGAD